MSESLPSADSGSQSPKDRRGFPRRRPRGAASLIPADKPMAAGTRITLINLSQGGLSFVIAKELAVGQRVLIELQAPGASRPITAQAEVRWVVPEGKPGQFRIGCAWVERLNYAHLVHFF